MRFYDWCVKHKAAQCLFPTLIDLPEMWRLNAKRFPGFNLVFCWAYLVLLPLLVPYTALVLVEAVLKWKFGREEA